MGDEYSPTFSPDGEEVAFAWNGEKQDEPGHLPAGQTGNAGGQPGGVYLIPTDGGDPRAVCYAPARGLREVEFVRRRRTYENSDLMLIENFR